MAVIRLANLLDLTSDCVCFGFVRAIRRNERGFDTIASYCGDAKSFHERYLSVKNCSMAKGVSLCFLELEKKLWHLTKDVRCESGKVKENYEEYAGHLQVCFHKRNHNKQPHDKAATTMNNPPSSLRGYGMVVE